MPKEEKIQEEAAQNQSPSPFPPVSRPWALRAASWAASACSSASVTI